MTEYIMKEQVIELLHYNSDEKCAAIIADVEELEPADVVEVVRCKDCKHRVVDEIVLSLSSRPETAEVCGIGVSGCLPGFYCGHGEKKDGEEECQSSVECISP